MHRSEGVSVQQPIFDDDENTEPSSAANTNPDELNYQHRHPAGIPDASIAGSFARLVEQTRMRLNDIGGGGGNSRPEFSGNGGVGVGGANRRVTLSDDDLQQEGLGSVAGALICGYLQKLGRNGKWQTRWFETDGECLSYYKSSKRKKLLATLDLEKASKIMVDVDELIWGWMIRLSP